MKPTTPKLALLRARWDHMAAVSGFDGLATAICEALGPSCSISLHMRRPSRSLQARFGRRVARICGLAQPAHEQCDPISTIIKPEYSHGAHLLGRLLQTHPAMVGLLLAGEEQFTNELVAAPESIRRRLGVVLHQPPSWLRLHWRTFRPLDAVKAVICLSTQQHMFLKSACAAPIIQLPHGVDLSHFRPAAGRPDGPSRLLLVGNWLRDFSTLHAAMRIAWDSDPTIELDCVVPRHARESNDLLRLAGDPRVRWHAGISADDLRTLYAAADLLFLPLIDATANNAVVEALACGLPIISSRVGGMSDYVTDTTGELCAPGDAKAHADAVLRWLAEENRRRTAAAAARRFAEQHLDWSVIAGTLLNRLGLQAAVP